MNKTLLYISLFLIFLCCRGQKHKYNEGQRDFEIKLDNFRYSLYAELDNIDVQKLMDFNFEPSDDIVIKINEFCENNKKEIKEYQRFILSKFTNFNIDISKYTKDTSFKLYNEDEIMELQGLGFNDLYRLITINPIDHAESIIQIILARNLTSSEMGVIGIRNTIGQPLIQTRIIGEDIWEILVDRYNHAYKFEYDLETRKMKILEVYSRKN